uniref:Uncharacterized protein n=1 Tax=Chromera velia CCMP2878 TaxID=1169474 RepID=A0A0G4FS18_9ALVE|eukprot:Cvel_3641.t1-p1 / transcript=Cvel_3641.t1 / gene=Cvel_3641 / organism=Chromera_velia_CCMP2878 / gene_product=hypothetical protein / transcript_product=hypothetical protein / location=Cvel_scaffold150:46365-65016(+) / protein_length=1795 / sequence_SO=supercontig / SO=protein_coding / is_pseudo=false
MQGLSIGQMFFRQAQARGYRSLHSPFHTSKLDFADLPATTARLLFNEFRDLCAFIVYAGQKDLDILKNEAIEEWTHDFGERELPPCPDRDRQDLLERNFESFISAISELRLSSEARRTELCSRAKSEFRRWLRDQNVEDDEREFVHISSVVRARCKKGTLGRNEDVTMVGVRLSMAGSARARQQQAEVLDSEENAGGAVVNRTLTRFAGLLSSAAQRGESQDTGQFKCALHFVIPASTLKEKNTVWQPDALNATPAETRQLETVGDDVFASRKFFEAVCRSVKLQHLEAITWDYAGKCLNYPECPHLRTATEFHALSPGGEGGQATSSTPYRTGLERSKSALRHTRSRLDFGEFPEEVKVGEVQSLKKQGTQLSTVEIGTSPFHRLGTQGSMHGEALQWIPRIRGVSEAQVKEELVSYSDRYGATLDSRGQVVIEDFLTGRQSVLSGPGTRGHAREEEGTYVLSIVVAKQTEETIRNIDRQPVQLKLSRLQIETQVEREARLAAAAAFGGNGNADADDGGDDVEAEDIRLGSLVDTRPFMDFGEDPRSGDPPFRLQLVEVSPAASPPCELALTDEAGSVIWSSNDKVVKKRIDHQATIITLYAGRQVDLNMAENKNMLMNVDSHGLENVPADPAQRSRFDAVLKHGLEPENLIHFEPDNQALQEADNPDDVPMPSFCFRWDEEVHAEPAKWETDATESSWPALQFRMPPESWRRFKAVVAYHKMHKTRLVIDGYQGGVKAVRGVPDAYMRHGHDSVQVFFKPKSKDELEGRLLTRIRMAKYSGSFYDHVFDGEGQYFKYDPPKKEDFRLACEERRLLCEQNEALVYQGGWLKGKRHGTQCFQRLEIPAGRKGSRGVLVYRYVGNFQHDHMVGEHVTLTLDLASAEARGLSGAFCETGHFYGEFDEATHRTLSEIRSSIKSARDSAALEARSRGSVLDPEGEVDALTAEENRMAAEKKARACIPLQVKVVPPSEEKLQQIAGSRAIDLKAYEEDRDVIIVYKGPFRNREVDAVVPEIWTPNSAFLRFDESLWTHKAKLQKDQPGRYQVAFTSNPISLESFLPHVGFDALADDFGGRAESTILPTSSAAGAGTGITSAPQQSGEIPESFAVRRVAPSFSKEVEGHGDFRRQTFDSLNVAAAHRGNESPDVPLLSSIPAPYRFMTGPSALIVYADGTTYKGEVYGGMPHGPGRMETRPHGRAEEFLSLEGIFHYGRPHCKADEETEECVLTELPEKKNAAGEKHPPSVWRGPMKDGQRWGDGVLELEGGNLRLSAFFLDDLPNENIEIQLKTPDLQQKYNCALFKSSCDDFGTDRMTGLEKYRRRIKEGRSGATRPRDGSRILQMETIDGTKFKGAALGLVPHGQATMESKTKKGTELKIEGKFENGKLRGPASIWHNGKLVFQGNFEDGLPEGQGTHYVKGDRNVFYKGNYSKGKREGHGTCRSDLGWQYTGLWYKDYPNDPNGKYEDNSGQSGTYKVENGKRVGPSHESMRAYKEQIEGIPECNWVRGSNQLPPGQPLLCERGCSTHGDGLCRCGPCCQKCCCAPCKCFYRSDPPSAEEIVGPPPTQKEKALLMPPLISEVPEWPREMVARIRLPEDLMDLVFSSGVGLWAKHRDTVKENERRVMPSGTIREEHRDLFDDHDRRQDFVKWQRERMEAHIAETKRILKGKASSSRRTSREKYREKKGRKATGAAGGAGKRPNAITAAPATAGGPLSQGFRELGEGGEEDDRDGDDREEVADEQYEQKEEEEEDDDRAMELEAKTLEDAAPHPPTEVPSAAGELRVPEKPKVRRVSLQ